ncbi:AAA family ATPase [uncultured Methanobrevibacter sp.]|uniref:AAA family ATPase n=1 Tax=uncultured Methanobrevibacter sp. TaxID=253161 RepID=UPI0025F0FA73|nr:AAA family ATPase [uncultured Methanobrevibacter sp.]
MDAEMLLEIENLGLINKANLEIGKINVIVGKNSTGKSTSSKFLFSLLTAASSEGTQLANNNIHFRLLNFVEYWKVKGSQEMEAKFNQVKNSLTNNPISPELFEEVYSQITLILEGVDFKDKELCINDLDSLFHIIKLNNDENVRYITVFNALVESEYGSSLNRFRDAHIKFHGHYDGVEFKQDIKIGDEKSETSISKDFLNYFNFQNVIYIDSPSILENNRSSSQYHLQMLERKLKKIKRTDDVYGDEFYKDLNGFKGSIDELIDGKFEYVPSEDIFLFIKDNQPPFSMQNTASGLKQLGVIQLLLDNNELTKNSFLILDEPEINLHPEFQVKLAEILVLSSKDLNITVYINTHSPFLAEAIEVYSKYHRTYEQTKFYLTQESENEGKFDYVLMDDMDIMEVYNNLGNPFDTLNEIRFEIELRNE